ncbi:MAG TPA: hypothetical protein VF824_10740 [Thermoanaerobaculia bacterium]|jgi:hypothetical protein
MTALPPNPYLPTNESVETTSVERTSVDGTLILALTETIKINALTGARELTKDEARGTTSDGRVIDDKSRLRVCETCRSLLSAARECAVCLRSVCGRCVRRVQRNGQGLEVCTSCRWRTLPSELLRLS